MEPLDDFRLASEPEAPAPEPGRPSRAPYWVAAAVIVLAAVAAGGWWYLRTAPGAAVTGPEATEAKSEPTAELRDPLGPSVEPIDLPPLVLTDPLVRELLGQLSSSPTLASWLATDGLIRAAVVSIENVASGNSPVKHLRALAPRAPFTAVTDGKTLTVDPRAYSRYDGLANAVASMDPAGLARVYSLLKPRLAEAYVELGHPDGAIDSAVERAIVVLLQAPIVEEPVVLRQRVLSYRYDRADLEALPAAQKQLLRMGPRNVRIVQEHLRALARELGVPAGRLPARQPSPAL